MTLQALFVLLALTAMIAVLAFDKMQPGLTLFSVVILFMAFGIITPSEAIAGFSNKGMITVAILFLVGEGIRQTGSLDYFIKKILPARKTTVPRALLRLLPGIAFISAFLNNTAVVVIFAPVIKKWATGIHLPARKFLIPLSYATILGGICTLIGTSTNLVVDGMMQEQGFPGFTMFELGKAGIVIALFGLAYLVLFGNQLLPGNRLHPHTKEEAWQPKAGSRHTISSPPLKSSAPPTTRKRRLALLLLILMVVGATIGEHIPLVGGVKCDMFFFAAITMIIMAWAGLFPTPAYTRYISWDILIAIASAFAISKAMLNSGIAGVIARNIILLAHNLGPRGLLAALFIITNLFTEIITNNAAAALSFPIAVAVATQLEVSPKPFFVVICIAASSSFSTPIGYQTNLIVQHIGGYRFNDYLKIGIPLNLLTFLLSILLIPLIWNF